MVFDHIEKLKREYTDKYVVVAGGRPELARFETLTGQVKTVNMNGRALVQFDAWNNIGWYDIELDFLKVVPKPEPKTAQDKVKESAPKAAVNAKSAVIGAPGEKKLSPLEMARQQGAAKPASAPASAAGVKKPSTADILAAARANKAAGAPAATASGSAAPVAKPKAAAPAKAAPTQDAPASAAETPAAKKSSALSGPLPKGTADIIAWCRAHDAK